MRRIHIMGKILVLCALTLLLASEDARSEGWEISPFPIVYSSKQDNISERTATIRTGIAELFKTRSDNDLLYLVFYPYEIEPKKWRNIFNFKKNDPENFFILKVEVRAKPIIEGKYPVKFSSSSSTPAKIYFVPTLITAKHEYNGNHGTGMLTIQQINPKLGGTVRGQIQYEDKDFSVNGKFEARFQLER